MRKRMRCEIRAVNPDGTIFQHVYAESMAGTFGNYRPMFPEAQETPVQFMQGCLDALQRGINAKAFNVHPDARIVLDFDYTAWR